MNSSAPDRETQHKYIHLVIKNKKVNIIKDLTKFLRKPFSLDDAKDAAAEFWGNGQWGGGAAGCGWFWVTVPAAERSPGDVMRGVEFLKSTRPSCWDQHFSNQSNQFFSLCDSIGGVFVHYSLHHHPNPTIEHCEMVCMYVRTKVQPEVFHVLQGDDLLDVWVSW